MTGGGTFRAEVNADGAFERLGRELSGYYRIGIEKDPGDADGKGRHMKVQVSRDSVTVRAREIFDVPVYEDRDWAARFAAAIDGPVLATELGLRVTSYLSADPDNPAQRRLLVTGEASRAQPGEATLHLVVNDLTGKKVAAGEVKVPHDGGDVLPFATNVAVPPGSYIVRVGVMDGAGRVGSVDHRAEVKDVTLRDLAATGPILVRVADNTQVDPRLALDVVGQDERLALEIDLAGDRAGLAAAAWTSRSRRLPTAPRCSTLPPRCPQFPQRHDAGAGGRRPARAAARAVHRPGQGHVGERHARRGPPRLHGGGAGARRGG